MNLKVKIILVALLINCIIFTASCDILDTSDANSNINQPIATVETNDINNDEQQSATEGETEAEESQTYADIGTMYKLGDWEVTVNSFEFVDKVKNGEYFSFTPDEGNKYLTLDTTVLNNAKTAASFLESFSMGDYVSVKLIYKGEYEYKATNLLAHDKGFFDSTIQPLNSKTGMVVITVPDTVINDFGNAELIFTYDKDKILYKLS